MDSAHFQTLKPTSYVSGVSLTHGAAAGSHIWTFAAGISQNSENIHTDIHAVRVHVMHRLE